MEQPRPGAGKTGSGPRFTTETPYVPYKAAIPPFIAGIQYTPSGEVTAAAEDAALAIRDFDHEFGDDVAPFSAVLLRTDSISSPQIENVTANARSVGMAELGDDSERNATLAPAACRSGPHRRAAARAGTRDRTGPGTQARGPNGRPGQARRIRAGSRRPSPGPPTRNQTRQPAPRASRLASSSSSPTTPEPCEQTHQNLTLRLPAEHHTPRSCPGIRIGQSNRSAPVHLRRPRLATLGGR